MSQNDRQTASCNFVNLFFFKKTKTRKIKRTERDMRTWQAYILFRDEH